MRQADQEALELDGRYQAAYIAANARNATEALNTFDDALVHSSAVMCRGTLKVLELLKSDSVLWTSFYKQVNQAARAAQYSKWDKGRQAVDSSLFPLYADEILFAALSLTDLGAKYYGDCHLVLKPDVIGNRASVFEENPFLFFRRHGVIVGSEAPPGFRATWGNRNKACVAKLHSRITKETVPDEFADILLSNDEEESDFVEVHIFGTLHRRAISKVTFVNARTAVQQVLIESATKDLQKLGIEVERID